MYRLALFLIALTSVSAATNTYILTGTGDGYRGAQHFTETNFRFTFTVETSSITHGTPCCASLYSTPSGTRTSVELEGFPPAILTGDQAIFANNGTSTAGIWHYNSAEYLTVTNSRFATNDLSAPFGGYSATGPAYAYATPMPLSTGDTLYFTSVHDVTFIAGPAATGPPSALSVSPRSGTARTDAARIYTFVVSDDAGPADIRGINILLQDPPTTPNACWLSFEAASNTMTVNRQNNWSTPVSIGAAGSTLTGDACTVDTTGVTLTWSGNQVSLAVPIRITLADNRNWPILLNVTNDANLSSGYQQVGTMTAEDPSSAPTFVLTVDPTSPQGVALGSSAEYTVSVQSVGGFNDTITFSGTATPHHSGNSSQLSFTFNPPSLQGSGTTRMTVSTASSDTPDIYDISLKGASQSATSSGTAGAVEASNTPPVASISPNTGAGTRQVFSIPLMDRIDLAGVNLLIASSLTGANACWIYFDPIAHAVFLASDDGTMWTNAGNSSASNSQCTVDGSATTWNAANDNKVLSIPVTFKPVFAGTKSLFVRANNYAGFDTGYQTLGGWTAQ